MAAMGVWASLMIYPGTRTGSGGEKDEKGVK